MDRDAGDTDADMSYHPGVDDRDMLISKEKTYFTKISC